MAINYPEGTQNLPSYATHFVYAQSNTIRNFSIGNGNYELDNTLQLNNVEIRNSTDVVMLDCRIYQMSTDNGEEYGYGWQYKDSNGNWQVITQNNTNGLDNGSRMGVVHCTHHDYWNHGSPTHSWSIAWKPGFANNAQDIRPCIRGNGNTGSTIYLNAFASGYSDGADWNRRSSSYCSATVYTTDGVN